jgi:DNA-binding response OmpR family regulator
MKGYGHLGGTTMRATILVIEEELDLRKLFGVMLQAEGYNARLVRDWQAAQAALAASQPDLIVFDWAITNAAGYLWADDLRNAPATAHIPLLFVCGDQPSRSMMQLLGNAGITVIEKPFDIFIFRKRVAALLTPLARMAGSNSVLGSAH